MIRAIQLLAILALVVSAGAEPAASQVRFYDMKISSFQTGGAARLPAINRLKLPAVAPVGQAATANPAYQNTFSCIPDSCPVATATAQQNTPTGLTGKPRVLGIGMLVPAVQAVRAAPKPPSTPTPPPQHDDDCMSCD